MSELDDLRIEFRRLDRAIGNATRDRSCVAWLRFSPECDTCYGTGATDQGRKAHVYDGGCTACGGTGRYNEADGNAALKRLREILR